MRIDRTARVPSSLPTSLERTFALRRGRAQWSVVAIWMLMLLALPAAISVFWLHLVNFCLLAVIGAVALNVLTGNARLISLGQAAFLGIGAFTAGLLDRAFGVTFALGVLAAGVAGAVVGLVVALLSLRLRALYVAVTTLVLHFAVVTLFAFVQAVFLDSSGIILPLPRLGPIELSHQLHWYYFLLIISSAVVIGALNIQRSHVGRRWSAVGEHDLAAQALGVSVTRSKISVFMTTSFVVSAAGALSAYYVGTVSFESYNLGLAIVYLAMIIVGGLGRVAGSVLGAVVITLLPYVLDHALYRLDLRLQPNVLAGIHQIVFGSLIIAFLLFEPRGLAEILRRIQVALAAWPLGYRSAGRGSR
jgi:branched-chain amino acid transport system permease protein